jgi:SepF-like predicted cell division protein (DUF552 family)
LRNLYKSLDVDFNDMFKKIRKAFGGEEDNYAEEDYLELDLAAEQKERKVAVKLFVLKKYEDVTKILNAIREEYTIAIIDFKQLKQRDAIELKRAVSKLKKTVDALGGSIAGHDNIVIVTPSFAKIYKEAPAQPEKRDGEGFSTY